jgi:hypothetical protein
MEISQRRGGPAVAPMSQSKPNGGVQPFHQFLVRWSQADVSATAYELFHAGSDRPEHAFLARQLRAVAQRWEKGLHLEIRHMQLRMPRLPARDPAQGTGNSRLR